MEGWNIDRQGARSNEAKKPSRNNYGPLNLVPASHSLYRDAPMGCRQIKKILFLTIPSPSHSRPNGLLHIEINATHPISRFTDGYNTTDSKVKDIYETAHKTSLKLSP